MPPPLPFRALALSLLLGATGAVGVPAAGAQAAAPRALALPAEHAPATRSVPGSTPTPEPVGGVQLARRGVIVNLAPGVPPPPAVAARSWVLADMTSGVIV